MNLFQATNPKNSAKFTSSYSYRQGKPQIFYQVNYNNNLLDPMITPFNGIGLIYARIKNKEKRAFQTQATRTNVCGVIISPNLVLTNAHTVLYYKTNKIQNQIYFLVPTSQKTTKQLKVLTFYVNPSYLQEKNIKYDLALLVLEKNQVIKKQQILPININCNSQENPVNFIAIPGFHKDFCKKSQYSRFYLQQPVRNLSQDLLSYHNSGNYKHNACPLLIKNETLSTVQYEIIGIHANFNKRSKLNEGLLLGSRKNKDFLVNSILEYQKEKYILGGLNCFSQFKEGNTQQFNMFAKNFRKSYQNQIDLINQNHKIQLKQTIQYYQLELFKLRETNELNRNKQFKQIDADIINTLKKQNLRLKNNYEKELLKLREQARIRTCYLNKENNSKDNIVEKRTNLYQATYSFKNKIQSYNQIQSCTPFFKNKSMCQLKGIQYEKQNNQPLKDVNKKNYKQNLNKIQKREYIMRKNPLTKSTTNLNYLPLFLNKIKNQQYNSNQSRKTLKDGRVLKYNQDESTVNKKERLKTQRQQSQKMMNQVIREIDFDQNYKLSVIQTIIRKQKKTLPIKRRLFAV